jgi:cell division septation protein DedD
VSAAYLARAGRRTLLLDLDPEVRWLEQILGEDFKEGVVDYLRFGVPLEGCARPTALSGLEAMSGGAAFLAGSPLDDPPGFRAALLSLRTGRDAVVVALPPPAESADEAGVPAICDAVVTIEDTEGPSGPLGTERAIVRLSGDPRAARELARLCQRFLGPLPALLAAGAGTTPSREAAVASPPPAAPVPEEPFWATIGARAERSPAPASDSEELDFLSAFEGGSSAATVPEPRVRIEDVVEASRARAEERRRAAEAPRRRPVDRRALTYATVVLAAIAALALGSRWFAPLFAGWTGDDLDRAYEEAGRSPIQAGEPGTVIPLSVPEAPEDSAAVDSVDSGSSLADAATGDAAAVASVPGRPAPWSVQVGAYRTAESARSVLRSLEQRGMTAFLSPVVLPERGEWVRVYVGAFEDREEARSALAELESQGIVEEGSVRDTPLAFPLGVYASAEEAERRVAELGARGIPAYALGDGPVRVWAGAFQNEEESRLLASALGAEETARLSRRER